MVAAALLSCNAESKGKMPYGNHCMDKKKQTAVTTTGEKPVTCKLTSKEMRERKATVIAELKRGVIERKELRNGYSYKFSGDDPSIDRVVTFIKTERACCGFFAFNLSISKDFALMEITGPKGAKEFIESEIDL